MPEPLIFPLLTDILEKLGYAAVQEIGWIYGVKEDVAELRRTFSAALAVLLDAEQQRDRKTHGVADWLGKFKDVAYDVDDLLNKIFYESTRRREVITEGKKAKKVCLFFSKHNPIAFCFKMARAIKNLRQRLVIIAKDMNKYQLNQLDRETGSFVWEEEVIGRDEEKEEVVKRLLEINTGRQSVSVDAIVGLGGLGKTMLAQSVFHHDKIKDAFDLRLWVCISQTFDVKIILEKIMESATKERPSGLEMDILQHELRDQIDGKKYLLVMDDVWNENGRKWLDLKWLLSCGAKGSKILITTRSNKVARISHAPNPYVLKGLSESNSWILLKKMAFYQDEKPKSPCMIEIGKEIAKKCLGVPLVIRTAGILLSSKTSEAEWLSFKNYELSTITQKKEEITRVLKRTYNNLPFHLKQCFAYCSLFPKDHMFEKDELIKLWAAEGFLESQFKNASLEDVGNEYFMELIRRSIFQDVQRNTHGDVYGCKLHTFMHDITRLVAGAECFAPDSDIKNVNEQTRRISFDRGGESKWSALFSSQLKPCKLRTFISWSSWQANESGLKTLISSLKFLRVLSLEGSSMGEIPFSIGTQKHLRFLNLSGNKEIVSLPCSITKLHNLQTLNLSGCSLKELPRDIGSLVNLRHLDLSENSSIELLPGSIVKLQFLQTLNLDECSRLKELPENVGNLVELRFLCLSCNELIELLPNSIAKLQKLQLLNLRGCSSLRELPRDVDNLVKLKHLDLEGCNKLRGVPLGLDKGPSAYSEKWVVST